MGRVRDEAGKVGRSHINKAPLCPVHESAFDLKPTGATERISVEEREGQSDLHLEGSPWLTQWSWQGWRREMKTGKPSKDKSSPVFGVCNQPQRLSSDACLHQLTALNLC